MKLEEVVTENETFVYEEGGNLVAVIERDDDGNIVMIENFVYKDGVQVAYSSVGNVNTFTTDIP